MVHVVFLALFLHLTPLNGRVLKADLNERPVMKVVRMLQDMKAELDKSLKDDQEVHEKLQCWCETNRREKTQAIEEGELREGQLKTGIDENVARQDEVKAKRKDTWDEMNGNIAALEQARVLRNKENAAYHEKSKDLMEAIKACDQALVVLKEYNPDVKKVKSAAELLQKAQVPHLSQVSGALRPDQLVALQNFLEEATGHGSSFLAIPGYRSYAPQSTRIFGVLQQMREGFAQHLSEEEKAEAKAAAAFAELKTAKEEEINDGRQMMTKIEQEMADLKVAYAEMTKELKDVQEQLELDRTFLANLEKRCAESKEEFDARMKSRREEIVAVSDTIAILNSDEAFDNFEKTVNTPSTGQPFEKEASKTDFTFTFLQKSMNQQELARRQSAAAVLQKAARATDSPRLALLAASTENDVFAKVITEIDKMVAEYTKQQADEVTHKDWCIDEKQENKRETEAGYHKKEAQEARIEDLKRAIEKLNKRIAEETAAIAELKVQMKRAGETRELENHEFQTTLADQRLTQTILMKAIERMREVYALMQGEPGAPHIETSGTHTDPGNGPARFTKYEQNSGGGRVVAMLEKIHADSQALENEAVRGEREAQVTYEDFMKDSNKSIKAKSAAIINMKEDLAKSQRGLINTKNDLAQTMAELENLDKEAHDLGRSCDFILKNFDARQEARAAEIEALRHAKAILLGAK